MFLVTRHRLMLVLTLLAVIAALGRLAQPPLEAWTHERLLTVHQQRLAELPEPSAAGLILDLAIDDRHLRLVASALEDARPLVAAAAERSLAQMIARWKEKAPEESSPLVCELASALAERSHTLPIKRRQFAHALAEQLLEWPIASREVDAGRLLADCETVLRQPLPVQSLPRLAANVAEPAVTATATPRPPIGLPGAPATERDQTASSERLPPVTSAKQPPAPLIGSNSEASVEPRQFLAPRGTPLSDEELPAVR